MLTMSNDDSRDSLVYSFEGVSTTDRPDGYQGEGGVDRSDSFDVYDDVDDEGSDYSDCDIVNSEGIKVDGADEVLYF